MAKHTIEDIEVSEAFENGDAECPLCSIEEKSESRLFQIIFLDMVMDPEFNKKLGKQYDFCREHFKKLYKYPDKLGLAMIVEKILSARDEELTKSHDFKVFNVPPVNYIHRVLNKITRPENLSDNSKCYICSRLEDDCSLDIKITIDLWQKDDNFKNVYALSKGFCLEHYNRIMTECETCIRDSSDRKLFREITFEVEKRNMERLRNELEWFIKKYDYRYRDMPWMGSRDSLPRSILKITGIYDV